MKLRNLVLRYAAFAVLAATANLFTQRLVLLVDPSMMGFAKAVLTGTGVGLVVKYLLDKRWIFYDKQSGIGQHGRKFTLYTAMGLVTTAIFWTTETVSWMVWKTDFMREAGAIAGLAVGYIIKYKLDRRFVFTDGVLNSRQV